jgi:hypothetical protein
LESRVNRIIKAITDYVLAQEADDITSYELKTPHYDDSNHRLVKAGLKTKWEKEHQKHVRKRTKFPIPICCPRGRASVGEETMEELCEAAKELDKKKERKHPAGKLKSWIPEDTFRLMRKKALARQLWLREQAWTKIKHIVQTRGGSSHSSTFLCQWQSCHWQWSRKGTEIDRQLHGKIFESGLKTNDKKTKAVAVEGVKAPTMMSKQAFEWQRGVGEGRTHRERALSKVQCQLCGAVSQKQGPPQHQLREACSRGREEWTKNPEKTINQRHQVKEVLISEEPALPQECCIKILAGAAKIECPVRDCLGRCSNPGRLQIHFWERHLEDKIVIGQEGWLPRCTNCSMFGNKVGASHQATKRCRGATERRQKQVVAKEHEQLKQCAVLNVSGKPIEIVDTFKHLGRVTAKTDSDEMTALQNLEQARKKWASSMRRVLIQDGEMEQNPKRWRSFAERQCCTPCSMERSVGC